MNQCFHAHPDHGVYGLAEHPARTRGQTIHSWSEYTASFVLAVLTGIVIIGVTTSSTVVGVASITAFALLATVRPGLVLPPFFAAWVFLQPLLQRVPFLSVNGIEISAGQALGFSVLLILTAIILRDGVLTLMRTPANGALLAFVTITFIAFAMSPGRADALPGFVRMLTGMVMFVAAQTRPMRRYFWPIINWVFSGIAAYAAVSVFHFVWVLKLGRDAPYLSTIYQDTYGLVRSAGAFGQGFGATSTMCFVGLLYGALLWISRRARTFVAIAYFFMLTSIAATFTRATLLALVCALVIFVLAVPGIRKKIRQGAVVSATVLSIGSAILVLHGGSSLPSRLVDIPIVGRTSIFDPAAFTGRVSLWSDAWEVFRSAPALRKIVGSGLGSSSVRSWLAGTQVVRPGCHNDYLLVLVETGVIGLIVYGWFWWSVARALGVRALGQHTREGQMRGAARAVWIAYGFCISNFLVTLTLAGYRSFLLLACGLVVGAFHDRTFEVSPVPAGEWVTRARQ